MDEMTWIELSPRHREHAVHHRIGADAITLGRAWDNDIVLDDAHVAAHHLRIARDAEGRWIAEDLGSINGLRVEGERRAQARVELAPGTTVRI
jgi:pSer/pThr/pTyr-binding forkhead associated (FHA) protein